MIYMSTIQRILYIKSPIGFLMQNSTNAAGGNTAENCRLIAGKRNYFRNINNAIVIYAEKMYYNECADLC